MFDAFGEGTDGSGEHLALGPRSTSRRGALWALAAVVLVVAVSVLLVRLVDTGPGAPPDPGTAAVRYVRAIADGQHLQQSSTCAGPVYSSRLVVVAPGARISVASVRRTSADHWTVGVRVDRPARQLAIHVELHRNRYVVC